MRGVFWLALTLLLALLLAATVVGVAAAVASRSGAGVPRYDAAGELVARARQRVSITQLSGLSAARELSDGRAGFGRALAGSGDSRSLYVLTYDDDASGPQVARHDRPAGGDAFGDAPAASSGGVVWPSKPYDYVSVAVSAAHGDVVVLASSSGFSSGHLATLRADTMRANAPMQALATPVDAGLLVDCGPKVHDVASGYNSLWLDAAGDLWSSRTVVSGDARAAQPPARVASGVAAFDTAGAADVLVVVTVDGTVQDYAAAADNGGYTPVGRATDALADAGARNVAVGRNGRRLLVAVDHDADRSGAFAVYQRPAVRTPWLRSSAAPAVRPKGGVPGHRYGLAMAMYDDEYALVGGSVAAGADVWHIDPLVGRPTYFYTVGMGHAPSRPMFFSPVVAEGRVWVAAGSDARFRPEVEAQGRVTVRYIDAERREVDAGDAPTPDLADQLQIAVCASGRWSTADAGVVRTDVDPTGQEYAMYDDPDAAIDYDPGYSVQAAADGGVFAVLVNRARATRYYTYDTYNNALSSGRPHITRALVLYSAESGAVTYDGVPDGLAALDSTVLYGQARVGVTASHCVVAIGAAYRVYSVVSPGGPPTLSMQMPGGDKHPLAVGTVDYGTPWAATAAGGFRQYAASGALRQTVVAGPLRDAFAASPTAVCVLAEDGRLSSHVYADGRWVEVAGATVRDVPTASLHASLDLRNVVVRSSGGDPLYYSRTGDSTLYVGVQDAATEGGTGLYEEHFVPTASRSGEAAFGGVVRRGHETYVVSGDVMLGFEYEASRVIEDTTVRPWETIYRMRTSFTTRLRRYRVSCGA